MDKQPPTSAAEAVCARARQTADAVEQLCRVSMSRPSMTPAEVADVWANLAAATAALPQAVGQLSDILEHTKDHYTLGMDSLAQTVDPDLAIDTAQVHLAAVAEPARQLHRLLADTQTQTAHIVASDPGHDPTASAVRPPTRRRPEEPPPQAPERGHGPPR